MDEHNNFERFFKANIIVSAALIACPFLYLFIAEVIKAKFYPFLGLAKVQASLFLRYLFYALAVLAVIVNRVLNSFLLKKSPNQDMPAAVLKLHRATIISVVLSELPALIGFILFLLKGLIKDFYALLFVSLVLEFMYFPRRKNWENYLKNIPFSCQLK